MNNLGLPPIIQGGMGAAVSSWFLARTVANEGQLGVVSGTALETVVARRLQNGDEGGHMQEALSHFPYPEVAEEILAKFYRAGGRNGEPFRPMRRLSIQAHREHDQLAVAANFVEVWLAKQSGNGKVGINFLEKLQTATPAALYGAMLAGVDAILMGAGIPREIPQLMTDFSQGKSGHLSIDSERPSGVDAPILEFDPLESFGKAPELPRPAFLAIVTAEVLASYLARNEITRPDGFIVEHYMAGGHNAPPRRMQDTETGYGPLDEPNIAKIRDVGLPFWMAGGRATPKSAEQAIELGAEGVQVGSLFALSNESGLLPEYREQMLDAARNGNLRVRTDHLASPTGFPFKVVELPGTVGEQSTYEARPRLCDLGYLRSSHIDEAGKVSYRCAAEPDKPYLKKGGEEPELAGRICLCNGLVAAVGLGQERPDGYKEAPLLTLGSTTSDVEGMLKEFPNGWSAVDVVNRLLSGINNAKAPV
ncbi:MAG: nitronate monooxygenase [Actinomycetes bacterium]|jgi:NAD(P)H-dependent flavin oxidoreductase YrpB (nitropropane dioxygenase family)